MAGFYRGGLGKTAVICGIGIAASFASLLLTLFVSYGFIMLYFITSVILSLCVVMSPLIFNNRDQTLMAQVPVSPAEQATFYTVCSAIAIPLAVQAVWYVLCIAAQLLTGHRVLAESYTLMLSQSQSNSQLYDIMPMWLYFLNSVLQTISGIMLVLWVVMCTRRKRRTMRAVLWYFGVYFVFGLGTGIVGFAVGFHDGIEGISNNPDEISRRVMDIILPMLYLFDLFCMGLCVFGVRSIYRHLRG